MSSYHEEQRRKMILRLRDLLLELPDFCFEYFRGIEPTTAERTRLGYAYDLKYLFSVPDRIYPRFSRKNNARPDSGGSESGKCSGY